MTSFIEQTLRCAVCGTEKRYSLLASTNALGYSDLDLRPAEMARHANLLVVQHCPFCGYCSTDIAERNRRAAAIVSSDTYRETLTDPALPDVGRHWLCCSYIEEAKGRFSAAGWSAMHAAWVCDDHGKQQSSDLCRQRAVAMFRRSRRSSKAFAKDSGTEMIVLADLLRRSGDFIAALGMCEQAPTLEMTTIQRHVLDFQKILISQQDRRCHTLEEVIRMFPSLVKQEEEEKLTPEEEHLIGYVLGHFNHLMSQEEREAFYKERRLSARFSVCRRIAETYPTEVFANRCPNCGRLPRTPRAKQCFWCGHNWRESTGTEQTP
jgi:hypothetical protein